MQNTTTTKFPGIEPYNINDTWLSKVEVEDKLT